MNLAQQDSKFQLRFVHCPFRLLVGLLLVLCAAPAVCAFAVSAARTRGPTELGRKVPKNAYDFQWHLDPCEFSQNWGESIVMSQISSNFHPRIDFRHVREIIPNSPSTLGKFGGLLNYFRYTSGIDYNSSPRLAKKMQLCHYVFATNGALTMGVAWNPHPGQELASRLKFPASHRRICGRKALPEIHFSRVHRIHSNCLKIRDMVVEKGNTTPFWRIFPSIATIWKSLASLTFWLLWALARGRWEKARSSAACCGQCILAPWQRDPPPKKHTRGVFTLHGLFFSGSLLGHV